MNWHAISSAVEHTFEWTWQTSLYASVLIVLVLAVQFAFGKCLSVRLRYALGLLVLLRLMVPAVPATSFSLYNLGRDFPAHSIQKEVRMAPAVIQALSAHSANRLARLRTAPTASAATSLISLPTLARVLWLAGLVVSLLFIWRRHHKFSRWINSQPVIYDSRVKTLLNECRSIMQVYCEVGIVRVPQPATPALFGWRRPRLLLPDGLCEKLDHRELRMVFLHELAHVKRGDILLNWIMVLVRSLHWFNPLVLLALRRLRADRELVCDAMVLAHLGAEERPAYGHTLIRLLGDFSGDGFCPSLAPVINHKHEIKRRVIMIAKFRPAGRGALVLSAVLVAALCCFTFTRAAEKQEKGSSEATVEGELDAKRKDAKSATLLEALKKELEQVSANVRDAQERVDRLRKEFGVSDLLVEGESLAEGGSLSGPNPQSVREFESERFRVESELRRLESLLKALKSKGESELQNIMNVAVPDELLTSLLKAKAESEQKLASLISSLGPENPEVIAAMTRDEKVQNQIKRRIEGIMAGLQVQMEATSAHIESLNLAVDQARRKDAKTAERLRPYLEARRGLQNTQKIREAIQLRILQETIDAALPKARSQEK